MKRADGSTGRGTADTTIEGEPGTTPLLGAGVTPHQRRKLQALRTARARRLAIGGLAVGVEASE